MKWIMKQWDAVNFQLMKTKNNLIKKFNPIKLSLKKTPVSKLGDHYSFIYVPEDFIHSSSIVYSVGVGEDILSDIELINKTNCPIFLFDPTPRSKDHFDYVIKSIKEDTKSYSEEGTEYITNQSMLEKLKYYPFALHTRDELVKFFVPKVASAVSHSIQNIQNTDEFIHVEAKRVSTLMKMLGHSKIDFLKLDIEGSEFDVLDDIIKDGLEINCIYVEYHYDKKIGMKSSIEKIQDSVNRISKAGYEPYFMEDDRYIGFIKLDLFKDQHHF